MKWELYLNESTRLCLEDGGHLLLRKKTVDRRGRRSRLLLPIDEVYSLMRFSNVNSVGKAHIILGVIFVCDPYVSITVVQREREIRVDSVPLPPFKSQTIINGEKIEFENLELKLNGIEELSAEAELFDALTQRYDDAGDDDDSDVTDMEDAVEPRSSNKKPEPSPGASTDRTLDEGMLEKIFGSCSSAADIPPQSQIHSTQEIANVLDSPRNDYDTEDLLPSSQQLLKNDVRPVAFEISSTDEESEIPSVIRNKRKILTKKRKSVDEQCAPEKNKIRCIAQEELIKHELSFDDFPPTQILQKMPFGNTEFNLNKSPTPRSAKHSFGTTYKVCFSGEKRELDQNIVVKLGGRVLDTVTDADLLVVENSKMSRRHKVLMAVSSKIPIVSSKWLHISKEKKYFVDPYDYIVEDKSFESQYNFRLTDLYKSNKTKFLNNHTIYITPNISTPPVQMLTELITANGGTCKLQKQKSSGKIIQYKNVFTISCSKDSLIYKTLPKPHVTPEVILRGIFTQKLNFEGFKIEN